MSDDSVTASRREFLKLGGIGAAATLAACERLPVKHALPYLVPPEGIAPGVSVQYASTCTACSAACGLIATVRDGRPVKLEGHDRHPLSRGGLCALGQADLRALYDGGRQKAPRWKDQPVSWSDLDRHVREALESVQGAGQSVVVLSRTLVSPTALRAVEEFLSPYRGTLVEYDPDPESASATRDTYAALVGQPVVPSLDLERTDLLVVFGADLLGTGAEPVTHTAAYAARRRAHAERGALRHVQIEGVLSLTGAAADERWRATASERRLLALLLLRHLAEMSSGPDAQAVGRALGALPELPRFAILVGKLATELLHHLGRSLVMARGDDSVEALAIAIANRLLANEGHTLDLERPSLVRRGREQDVLALLESLKAGQVGALFVVDADPVDQWPDGAAIAAAVARVPLSVAITDRPTATAAACAGVAASHHGLECWGDFEPRRGLLTLAQPAIRPLFDTRPPFENFLRWAGASQAEYHGYLRERWGREVLPAASGSDLEALWTDAVRSGMAPGAAARGPSAELRRTQNSAGKRPSPAEALRAALTGLRLDPPSSGFELELIAEVGVRDGSRAHVPWLRELPDPLTRVAWTPCLRLAPETVDALGLADGVHVKVSVGSASVTLPVRAMPGQHPRVAGVPVGYGRVDGGPFDPTRNGYRLASVEAGRIKRRGLIATLAATGTAERLPAMQSESTTNGRPIVHQVATYDARIETEVVDRRRDLWPNWRKAAPQWHMVIDLDACTGCSACVVACQAENNIAVVGKDEIARNRDMHWLRIDRYFQARGDDVEVLFEPMLCAQCGHAPCETVCPVAATVHSEDGLNQQVYNRCVGTRYCANNCPYKVRRFNWFDNETGMKQPLERMVLNPDVVVRARGVMEKCTFCVQRIQAARIAARAEGEPGVPGVKTACQQSCPARAIRFGDAVEPEGEIARAREAPRAFQVLADLGIEPAVTYQARVRNREAAAAPGGERA